MSEVKHKKAAVLWSGGKDCCLAMHEAKQQGWTIDCLVTFVPPEATFRAHSLEIMERQAEAMGIEHVRVEINEPFDVSYREGIKRLRDERGISALVTGDIAEVDGHPNWVRQRAEGTGVEVLTPLWYVSREMLLERMINEGFRVMISAVRGPCITPDWLGRTIDSVAMGELRQLNAANGLDPCGENGEFHTVVLDGPEFRKQLKVSDTRPREHEDLTYLEIGQVTLEAK